MHSECKEIAMVNTVGFAVADEDRHELDELVAYFGQGNRSSYLRATLKVMRSVKIAEELRELQAYGQTKLAEAGHTLEDVPALVRRSRVARSGR
jgi:hypothetical protein